MVNEIRIKKCELDPDGVLCPPFHIHHCCVRPTAIDLKPGRDYQSVFEFPGKGFRILYPRAGHVQMDLCHKRYMAADRVGRNYLICRAVPGWTSLWWKAAEIDGASRLSENGARIFFLP